MSRFWGGLDQKYHQERHDRQRALVGCWHGTTHQIGGDTQEWRCFFLTSLNNHSFCSASLQRAKSRVLKLIEKPPLELVFAKSWRRHALARLSALRFASYVDQTCEPFNLPDPPLECQREQNGQTFRNFLWEKRLGEGELRQYGESSVAKKRRKYSPSAGRDVESEMRRYKRGTAKSGRGGKGGKVKSRKAGHSDRALEGAKERKARPEEKTLTNLAGFTSSVTLIA